MKNRGFLGWFCLENPKDIKKCGFIDSERKIIIK